MIWKQYITVLFFCGLAHSAGSALVSRPIPLSMNGNALLDLDGNGTMDAIQLRFLGNHTPVTLAEDVDTVIFPWVDSTGKEILLRVLGSQFRLQDSNSHIAYYQFPNPRSFFPFLTSFDTARFSYSVDPQIHTHLPDGRVVTMPLRLMDGMLPIVRKAELSIGKDYNSPDKLVLEFSEPISALPGADLRKMLEVFRFQTKSQEILIADKASLMDSRHVVLEFSHSQHGMNRPNSQDSIRILDGFLYHPSIGPCSSPLCAQRPWRVVLRNMVLSLGTSSLGIIREQEESRVNMEVLARSFGAGAPSELGAGVFLDFGSTDLLQSIRIVLKDRVFQKDSSVIAETIPVDVDKIYMDLGLNIFSNFGEFVASGQFKIACRDTLFQGDCVRNPKQVFLRWNGMSQPGRKVASGAYVAQISLRVRYGDSYLNVMEIAQEDIREIWGIMRTTAPD